MVRFHVHFISLWSCLLGICMRNTRSQYLPSLFLLSILSSEKSRLTFSTGGATAGTREQQNCNARNGPRYWRGACSSRNSSQRRLTHCSLCICCSFTLGRSFERSLGIYLLVTDSGLEVDLVLIMDLDLRCSSSRFEETRLFGWLAVPCRVG